MILSNKKTTLELGNAEFVHALYSTIITLAKPDLNNPVIKLLEGNSIQSKDCLNVAKEFNKIRDILSRFSPDCVVWDLNDKNKLPPWGNNISPVITSLGNYFITATGKDLFTEVVLFLVTSFYDELDVQMI